MLNRDSFCCSSWNSRWNWLMSDSQKLFARTQTWKHREETVVGIHVRRRSHDWTGKLRRVDEVGAGLNQVYIGFKHAVSYRHVLSQLQCRVHNCHSVVFTSSICQQAHQAEPLFSPLQPGALGIITATDLSSPHWLQLAMGSMGLSLSYSLPGSGPLCGICSHTSSNLSSNPADCRARGRTLIRTERLIASPNPAPTFERGWISNSWSTHDFGHPCRAPIS